MIAGTPGWHEWRRQGIGGSDAPIITGDSRFRSPLSLWLEKCGMLERELDSADDLPRWWGKRLEDSVIERFVIDTELHIALRQLCLEHHLDSWRRATLDALVFESDGQSASDALGLLEVKMTSRTNDWEDGIPAEVMVQVQHNLDVAEFDHAWLAVLFTAPVLHFKSYEIDRDESILLPLRDLERKFWQSVLDRQPPPAAASDLSDLKRAYQESVEDAIELDDSQEPAALIEELRSARADKNWAERRVETAEAMLAVMLKEHEAGMINGSPAIFWKRHERTYFDADALRSAYPKIADQFTSKRGYRQFSFPKRNSKEVSDVVEAR